MKLISWCNFSFRAGISTANNYSFYLSYLCLYNAAFYTSPRVIGYRYLSLFTCQMNRQCLQFGMIFWLEDEPHQKSNSVMVGIWSPTLVAAIHSTWSRIASSFSEISIPILPEFYESIGNVTSLCCPSSSLPSKSTLRLWYASKLHLLCNLCKITVMLRVLQIGSSILILLPRFN